LNRYNVHFNSYETISERCKGVKKALCQKRNINIGFFDKLEKDGAVGIEIKYRPHKLSGNYKDNWEAHIKADLLIIWFEITENDEIILLRTGSHSDLF
jgi:mRNA interferase YafQ